MHISSAPDKVITHFSGASQSSVNVSSVNDSYSLARHAESGDKSVLTDSGKYFNILEYNLLAAQLNICIFDITLCINPPTFSSITLNVIPAAFNMGILTFL